MSCRRLVSAASDDAPGSFTCNGRRSFAFWRALGSRGAPNTACRDSRAIVTRLRLEIFMRRAAISALLILTAGSLRAQTAASHRKAAEAITREDVARHVGVIADDSMVGRQILSTGL